MALAAMASTASMLPDTSLTSTPETMFAGHLNMSNPFQGNVGLNNAFSNNIASEIGFSKSEKNLCSSITSSTPSQSSYLNTQLNDGQGTTTSALKAALQFSAASSDVKPTSSKACK